MDAVTEIVQKCLSNTDTVSVNELVKFLYLKKQVNDTDATLLSPTYSIDYLWHRLILFTREYQEINKILFENDSGFLHHRPLGAEEDKLREERLKRTKEEYLKTFGEIPEHIWHFKNTEYIVLRTADGSNVNVFVDIDTQSVLDLKARFMDIKGVPCDYQRIIFRGRQLNDDEKLRDCKIKYNSVIHVMQRLKGC